MTLYLRENGIVPPTSRAKPPELKDKYGGCAPVSPLVRIYTNIRLCTYSYENKYLHIFVQIGILARVILCLPQSTAY